MKLPNLVANLENILKKLNPINIQETQRLFMKSKTNAEEIKNKKIILFLGGTGAGKSTTICYLAGCKMKKIAPGQIEIHPKPQIKIPCKIGSSTKSETKCINPIRLEMQKIMKNFEEEIYLCDAPGFLDTEGPEVDMANGLGIIKAVKGCKAVKPIIIFSKINVGARYENVESLLSTLVGIISSFCFQLPNIDFLFTHFSEEDREIILEKFTELKENKENSKNEHDKLIFKILNYIVEKGEKLKIVDPLDGHPKLILKDWIENPKFIKKCDEIFNYNITIESKSKVVEHCSLMKDSILNNVRNFKKYEIADFKLNQLKLLHSIVGIKEIEDTIKICVNEICSFLNNSYNETCEAFNKCFIDGNLLRKEDLDKFNESINLMKRTKNLKENHLGENVKWVNDFESNFELNIDKLLLLIKEKNNINSNAIAKIFAISKYFPENEIIKGKTKTFREEMEKKIEKAFNALQKELKNLKSNIDDSKIGESLEICVSEFLYLEDISVVLEQFFGEESQKKTQIKDDFIVFFKSLSQKPSIEGSINEEKGIEIKIKHLKILEMSQNFTPFEKIISCIQLKEYYDIVLHQIQSHCQEIFSEIQKDFTEKNPNMSCLEQRFHLLSLYKNKLIDPKYKSYIENTIKNANGFLKQTMEQIQSDINNSMVELMENKMINTFKLFKSLKYLYNSEWVKDYIPNFVHYVHSELQTTLGEYFTMQKEKFLQFDLDIKKYEKIPEAVKFLEDISKFKDSKILRDDLKLILTKIDNHFENSIEKVLNTKYDLSNNLETTNNLLNYLIQIEDNSKIQNILKNLNLKKNYVEKTDKMIAQIKLDLISEIEKMEIKLAECLALLNSDHITQMEIDENCKFILYCFQMDIYNQNYEKIPEITEKITQKIFIHINEIIKNIHESFQKKNCEDLVSQDKIFQSLKKSCDKLKNIPLKYKFQSDIEDKIQKSYEENFLKHLEILPSYLNFEAIIEKQSGIDSMVQNAIFSNELLEKSNEITCIPSLKNDIDNIKVRIQKILQREQQIFDEYCSNFKQNDSKKVELMLKQRKNCDQWLEAIMKKSDQSLKNMENLKITTQQFVDVLINKFNEKEKIFKNLDFLALEKKDAFSRSIEYDRILNELEIIKDFEIFEKYNSKFSKSLEKAFELIKNRLETHFREIENYYLKNKEKTYFEEDCIKLDKKIVNLKMFADKFPIFQKSCTEKIENIKMTLISKFSEKKMRALNSNNVEIVMDALLQFQALNYIEDIKKPEWLDEILLNFKKNAEKTTQNAATQELNKLGALLQGHPLGKILVSENKIFKGLNLSYFNEKLQKYGIDEVLKTINGQNLDLESLKKRYEDGFKPKYESLVEKYLKPKPVGIDLQAIKNSLKLLLEKIGANGMLDTIKSWFIDSKKLELPNILAHLFAIWTLMNADDFFDNTNQVTTESKGKYLYQPHCAQVISIFRMLSCGDSKETITNNLIQIGTGEGKSLTLAMTSTVLALLGYSVDCACYSPYLSARDYEDFKKFFSFLDVLEDINYGSFNLLC